MSCKCRTEGHNIPLTCHVMILLSAQSAARKIHAARNYALNPAFRAASRTAKFSTRRTIAAAWESRAF